jgi:hypothetical protein
MVFLPRHRASLLSKISVWVIVDPIVASVAIKLPLGKAPLVGRPFQGGFRGESTQG